MATYHTDKHVEGCRHMMSLCSSCWSVCCRVDVRPRSELAYNKSWHKDCCGFQMRILRARKPETFSNVMRSSNTKTTSYVSRRRSYSTGVDDHPLNHFALCLMTSIFNKLLANCINNPFEFNSFSLFAHKDPSLISCNGYINFRYIITTQEEQIKYSI